MVKIIGHRGAAGLALENSIESVKKALELNVDGIEFDVRRTKDDKLVVLHNAHTGKISSRTLVVSDATLDELRAIPTHNKQPLATPEEILRLIGTKKPIVIDVKDSNIVDQLVALVKKFPKSDITFTGKTYSTLSKIHQALPDKPFFVQSHLNPIEIVQTAKSMKATGITLNMWLINPLTYHLAQKYGLKIFLYTVDRPQIMRFIKKLYPNVTICTNHPERFV
jgi:glycerophosphoryl diester phosphodiesterase